MEAKEDSEAKEDLEAREAKEAKEVKNFVHAFVLPLPWAFTIGISVFVRSAVLHLQPNLRTQLCIYTELKIKTKNIIRLSVAVFELNRAT